MAQALCDRIRLAYRNHPEADSKGILKIVGCKDTTLFWQTLVAVQQELRHYSAGQRKNHQAHPFRVVRG